MLSDFYGWKSLASLDLHGPHLSGGDVVFRAVIGPVPAGGPDEHPPVQRHPHRQHLAPSRPHTSGQAAQAPPHQKGKRRIQDRLSRADLQRHPPGKSISFAEKAHHFYRRPGLLRLQKAAVHQYVDPGAGRSPPYCEFPSGSSSAPPVCRLRTGGTPAADPYSPLGRAVHPSARYTGPPSLPNTEETVRYTSGSWNGAPGDSH